MPRTYLGIITGSFSTPAIDNPTVVAMEAAYRHHGLDARYLNCEIAKTDLAAAVAGARAMHWAGFNCSIPHKVAVIDLIDGLAASAEIIGAVNCVVATGEGLIGHNTDGQGFVAALTPVRAPAGANVVVLGTGGAAQAVAFVFSQKKWPFRFVSSKKSRPDALGYADLDEKTMSATDLIVNTTPLGMAPTTEDCPPLPFFLLKKETNVFDLIYNPPETVLLRRAAALGCPTQNGLDMLLGQADAAWEIFK